LFVQIDPQGRLTREAMSDRSVARLIQRYAAKVGLDPATVGGHSLRAGFLTEAARTKASLAKIAVGTPITERPPHRSTHAAFPHVAPTLGV
jgi:hypothetical protein